MKPAFYIENTEGFEEGELECLNEEFDRRFASDELQGIDPEERRKIISERILERY